MRKNGSDVFDGLQHLRHERGARTNQSGARCARPNADGCVVGAEATGVQRIVFERVAVAIAVAFALFGRTKVAAPSASAANPKRSVRAIAASSKNSDRITV
jgi:hypothetical protein